MVGVHYSLVGASLVPLPKIAVALNSFHYFGPSFDNAVFVKTLNGYLLHLYVL